VPETEVTVFGTFDVLSVAKMVMLKTGQVGSPAEKGLTGNVGVFPST
jgi:hypothetical protein